MGSFANTPPCPNTPRIVAKKGNENIPGLILDDSCVVIFIIFIYMILFNF